MEKVKTNPVDELLEKLQNGVEVFTYIKSDGSERRAAGTRKSDLIPLFDTDSIQKLIDASLVLRKSLIQAGEDLKRLQQSDSHDYEAVLELVDKAFKPFEPKEKKSRPQNDSVVTYYDFEAKGWRAFKKDALKI